MTLLIMKAVMTVLLSLSKLQSVIFFLIRALFQIGLKFCEKMVRLDIVDKYYVTQFCQLYLLIIFPVK